MSDFVGEGVFTSFPNLHSDLQEVGSVVEWPDERLAYKTDEYSAFVERDDPMPRAMNAANLILGRLLFEARCRDGLHGA